MAASELLAEFGLRLDGRKAEELRNIKVSKSKFQNQIFLFSLEPKTQRNYFLISALASKKRLDQIIKGNYHKLGGYLV